MISFLDECMLRCAKTPYRYIEASRQFLKEHGSKANTIHTGKADSDLQASPWLMSLYEQFTIRVEKGIFDADAGTVDALTAFFARLLPGLCAYTLQTNVSEVMVTQIRDRITSNIKYESSFHLATTAVSKINSLRAAPEASSIKSPKKSKQPPATLFDGKFP